MLPVATHQVQILRGSRPGPYEAATTETTVAATVGVLSSPTGAEDQTGGGQELTEWDFTLDQLPAGTSILPSDVLRDCVTGARYDVLWARQRPGPLPHWTGRCRQTRGLVPS